MMRKWKYVVLYLVLILLVVALAGCSNSDVPPSSTATPVPVATVIPTAEPSGEADVPASAEVTGAPPLLYEGLNATQLNSINMLNHLVVLTQEINASRNSRLYLEEAYSLLINNTSPEAVDNRTLVEINSLLDTLERYRMIAVKRDRLHFIYEQNQAQALRDAVPNPLAMMNTVSSFSLSRLVTSVVYMAVDSYSSYQSSSAQADLQYLQDGWALDDEQDAALHQIRKDAFNYMIETVQTYQLPGALVLTEKAVSDFVEWKNKSNTLQVIQYFEQNVETYRAFGPYWLTLAECYYEVGDYQKCLAAVSTYEQLDNRIFRRDFSYARILPLAIISARYVYDDAQYVETATRYIAELLENTSNEDWALRYFAAQANLELYSLTGDSGYLDAAYTIALNNVNYLIDAQLALNAEYLADVVLITPDKSATKAQKDEINNYNKMLKAERTKALPPVYEPLLLNCQLLFALADELDIADSEVRRLDGILHENGAALFLIEPLDMLYRIAADDYVADPSRVSLSGNRITVPAIYVTDDAAISVTITHADGTTLLIDDWVIEKVDRPDKNDITSFIASYTSKVAQGYSYVVGDVATVEIVPKAGYSTYVLTCSYTAVQGKILWVINSVDLQRNGE